jgi:hypothetical protein
MSLESCATLGQVDTINTTGVKLSDINCRGFLEGTQVWVKEKAAFYVLEIGNAYVIDHDVYETARNLPGGQWAKIITGAVNVGFPLKALSLTDADQTLTPGTSKVSQYTQSITLTNNRTKTINTTSCINGQLIDILRSDSGAFTMTIINGGSGGGTLYVFTVSPTEIQGISLYFNGVDFIFVGFKYMSAT